MNIWMYVYVDVEAVIFVRLGFFETYLREI